MDTIAPPNPHTWIYAVLIEMNEYCRNEGLDEVSSAITQAIERMEPVVFVRDLAARTPARVRHVSPFSTRTERAALLQETEAVPFPFRA